MKNLFYFVSGLFLISISVEARDLSYKFGVGYREAFTTARVNDDAGPTAAPTQINGLEATYGITRDVLLGGFFGFVENFNFAMMGPTVRYNFERLINRDATIWNNLHLFTEVSF